MAAPKPVQPKRVRKRVNKPEQRQKFYDAKEAGMSTVAAAKVAEVTEKTGRAWVQDWLAAGNDSFELQKIQGPRTAKNQMGHYAREAIDDFSLFQERYLGRVALPWQKDAAETIVKLAKSPEEEFLVINCPPGSGKSTLMIHDIGAWMIARDRNIRICIISSTGPNATKFTDQLRRTLEAETPVRGDAKLIKQGMAKDAATTLAKDFGRFKPELATDSTWTKDKFRVDRPVGTANNKEMTVEAFGRNQAFLGGRFDVVICDDIQDPSKVQSKEELDKLKELYSDIVESRLEQGGLLVVNMQRVGADDISRYCLDMPAWNPEDDENVDQEDEALLVAEREAAGIDPLPVREGHPRKYRHIIYKAHFDGEDCKGAKFHGRTAPAYPEGCLLFPRKLTFQKLEQRRLHNEGKFRLWFQQEEVELGNVLVEPIWVAGGIDQYGIDRPGCWDTDRSARQLPYGLNGADLISFISVDPSPTQYWAVAWFAYHAESKHLFLMDLVKQKMTSPQFFDVNPMNGAATGVLIDMVQASRAAGAPITHWIHESNAAQRFMYQSSHIQTWLRTNSIALLPHTTTVQNKNSEAFGVQQLQSWFRDGRIRLPGRQDDDIKTRMRSLKLVDEATKYVLDSDKQSTTTDCVMAAWFAVFNVENLRKSNQELPRRKVPSWVSRPNLGVISA